MLAIGVAADDDSPDFFLRSMLAVIAAINSSKVISLNDEAMARESKEFGRDRSNLVTFSFSSITWLSAASSSM